MLMPDHAPHHPDDVSPLGFFKFKEHGRGIARHRTQGGLKFAILGNLQHVREFIDQNMIADLQTGNHGTRGNLESLNEKHTNGQSQD